MELGAVADIVSNVMGMYALQQEDTNRVIDAFAQTR